MKTHTGIKPHVCTVCNKGFYVANKLTKHMRTHTGERPYACTVCPKRFTSSDVLKVHERIHTGEKPYVCQNCNKGFVSKSRLTAHIKTHDSKKKKNSCGVCLRYFESLEALQKHNCGEKEYSDVVAATDFYIKTF